MSENSRMNKVEYINKMHLFYSNYKLIIIGILLLFALFTLNSCNNDSLGVDSNVQKTLVTPATITVTDTAYIPITATFTVTQSANIPGTIVPYSLSFNYTDSIFVKPDNHALIKEFFGTITIIIDTTVSNTEVKIKNLYVNMQRVLTPQQQNIQGLYQLAFNVLDLDYSYATVDKYLPGDVWDNTNDWSYISVKDTSAILTYNGSQTKSSVRITEIPVEFDHVNHKWKMQVRYTTSINPNPNIFNSFKYYTYITIYYIRNK